MALGSERSKPLHNFSLPCLKWGNQRFLRCVKVAPEANDPSLNGHRSWRLLSQVDQFQPKQANTRNFKISPTNPFHISKRKYNTQKDIHTNNIEAVREKLMIDLRVAAKKLKVPILEGEGGADVVSANVRPWNLRTRRAACKAPREEEKFDVDSSPMKTGAAVMANENPVSVKKKDVRAKFSVSLSKDEVGEDFAAMLGTRPPRRPKKRPKIVLRQLDSLFPGIWLTEVTTDTYKVSDDAE